MAHKPEVVAAYVDCCASMEQRFGAVPMKQVITEMVESGAPKVSRQTLNTWWDKHKRAAQASADVTHPGARDVLPVETIGELLDLRWRRGMACVAMSRGQFSKIDVLREVLRRTGPADVVVATWTMGVKDMGVLEQLLEADGMRSLRLLVDRSLPSRRPGFVKKAEAKFGRGSIRAMRTHAKFLLVTNEHWQVAVVTTANLNKNERIELFAFYEGGEVAGLLADMVARVWKYELPEGQSFAKWSGGLHREVIEDLPRASVAEAVAALPEEQRAEHAPIEETWLEEALKTRPARALEWEELAAAHRTCQQGRAFTALGSLAQAKAKFLRDLGADVRAKDIQQHGESIEDIVAELTHPDNAPGILTHPRVLQWIDTWRESGCTFTANRALMAQTA